MSDQARIRSRAELAAELQRFRFDHERKTGRSIKPALLARHVGVSRSSVYAYLNGTTLPPLEIFGLLLDTLGVPASEQRRLATARDDLEIGERLGSTGRPRPALLPPDVTDFTGREDVLAEIRRALFSLADVAVAQAADQRARQYLRECADIFTEHDMPTWVDQARHALGKLDVAVGAPAKEGDPPATRSEPGRAG